MDTDGFKHFYEFYEKLNVISEISNKTTTNNSIPSDPTQLTQFFNKIFGDSKSEKDKKKSEIIERPTLQAILDKQHESGDLIKTFMYDKPTGKTVKPETNSIAKNLRVGSTAEIILIAINKKAEIQGNTTPTWFESGLFSIFNLDEFDDNDGSDEATEKKNIKELHSANHKDYTVSIKSLFQFHDINGVDTGLSNYVWNSKYNMLGLLTQPFLLLTFDMYFYNVKGAPLFKKNFDVIDEAPDVASTPNKVSVESLLAIDIFKRNQLPTFLMLLIYYAGYNFDITTNDITSKFRNKFNQSSNKTSFPIKLYVPISHTMETKYNNLLKSAIKPNTVDLKVETLEVYHVGYQIASLWDYVNGKLTILINNMLNTKDDKARFTDLFKKKYTSNSLFLFECINELKKYKEYILNSSNILVIEFPMSTLKTLEILILKLSYILSVLEPTFIPIETMSFDVVMNGKTLKYVINSELQATNISIDDNISNDKLMAAILSTRAGIMDTTASGKITAELLLSDTESKEIIKSSIQKEADIYRSNTVEKNIAFKKIDEEFKKSEQSLKQLEEEYRGPPANYTEAELKLTELYMYRVVQNSERKLAHEKANQEKLYADEIYSAATTLLDAFNNDGYPDKVKFDAFRKPKPITKDPKLEQIIGELNENKQLLASAAGQSPEQLAKLAKSRKRRGELPKRKTSSAISGEAGETLDPDGTSTESEATELVKVTIKNYHTVNKRRCGFSFGRLDTVIQRDYKLGKIVNTDKNNIQVNMLNRQKKYTPEEWWPFTKNTTDETINIDKGYILSKIELIDSRNSTKTPYWNKNDDLTLTLGEKKSTFDNDTDKKEAMKLINGHGITDSYSEKQKRQYEDMIYKQMYLFDKLENLVTDNIYEFTFEKPELQSISTVDQGFTGGGGKNTTKKVNRKQRQGQRQGETHSKTKKVFES